MLIFCAISASTSAITKTSAGSGMWNLASTWTPAGVPASNDDVIIATNHTVTLDANRSIRHVTINPGGNLIWQSNRTLAMSGDLTVNGTATMDGGLIFGVNKSFTIGNTGTFIWNPASTTAAAATLFTNSTESFNPSSTLIIKKWHDYNVPIGSVVSSNFGNLTLNSPNSPTTIAEWNQNNWFQTRTISGTLTVDFGWITLDKSGSISNTTIGGLVLISANSYFYGHSGNHPSGFTLNTGAVSNTGGSIVGLNNGNGNITMNVSGNFTNLGNVKLVNNSGVANVGNGNATFNVAGTYSQSAGDTRFIYNISTTNCGTYTATINNLTLTGGIFMGQTGVHTGGGTCALNVTNNFSVAFQNTTDKFRGTSLSSIGPVMNTAKFQLNIGGNLIIGGPAASEFTSGAGTGTESIAIGGNTVINGGGCNFNYGTAAASHDIIINIFGTYSQSGGYVYLSRNGGVANAQINGALLLSAGTLAIKGSTGSTDLTVSGNYTQSGGTLLLHNNPTEITTDAVTLNINGDFGQNAGTINFDDNTSNSSATHVLNISGNNCSLSGSGLITHAGPGTCLAFGQLNFNATGTTLYTRVNTHSLTQVKQTVLNGNTLRISSGSIQVTSHSLAGTDYFRIAPGGRLELLNSQLFSNTLFPNSGIQVDSGGILSITRPNGLYDGTLNGSINSNGNMDYFLDGRSIIEYAGFVNQVITGTGNGIATGTQHQYGILRIAIQGPAGTYAAPSASNVNIRTQLQMNAGELNLNGWSVFILNGNSDGISRTTGYVKSEMNASVNTSRLVWQNLQPGDHVFPFGINNDTYLPVTFTPVSGFGNSVSVSTRATLGTDNQPLALNTALAGTPSAVVVSAGTPDAQNQVIDRWWEIDAPGITANVVLSYSGSENTTSDGLRTGQMGISSWNGASWTAPAGSGTGIVTGIGTVTVLFTNQFGNIIIVSNDSTLPIELTFFEAYALEEHVRLDWVTATEVNNDFFTIERSKNGIDFEAIQQINGAGNSTRSISYSASDNNPFSGLSYYRLKQTDYDGKFSYSEIRAVNMDLKIAQNGIEINTVGPNPFESSFIVNYLLGNSTSVTFRLTDSSGKQVYEEQQQGSPGKNKFEFQRGDMLQSGTYILQIITEESAVTRKLIRK